MIIHRTKLVTVLFPLFLTIAFLVYDLVFLCHFETGRENGLDYIKDVRVINGYIGTLLVVLSILLGFFGKEIFKNSIKSKPLNGFHAPFVIAIIASCLSLIFFPIPYTDNIEWARVRWIFSLVCEQTAVVYTCVGFLTVIYLYKDEAEADSNAENSK